MHPEPAARSVQTELHGLLSAALLLGLGALFLVGPLLAMDAPADGAVRVIGDAQTDAVRGLWGLDHVRRSLLPPDLLVWSREIGLPGGAVGLVLPTATAALLSPLGLLLGPVAAWNVATVLLLFAAGLATAFLVRRLTGSWAAGTAAGAVLLAQPGLLHALGDGTAELLAIWTLPAFFATATEALRGRGRGWGLAAGLLAIAIALDSPYYAVFTAVMAPLLLPWPALATWRQGRRGALLRSVAPLALLAVVGALGLAALAQAFPLDDNVVSDSLESLRGRNSVDLAVWWHLENGPEAPRDPSLAPTLIPALTAGTALVLALIGLPRGLPWLLAAAVTFVLALGLDPDNPTWLAAWFGSIGGDAGRALIALNRSLYELPGISGIRFPNRWLTATALCLATAGGFGLARIFALLHRTRGLRLLPWPLAAFLGAHALLFGIDKARLHTAFPQHELPRPAFAAWIADRPGGGAVATLPRLRPAPPSGRRADVEVFAGLDPALASADLLWFQVVHRRPMVDSPDLQTLSVRDPGADVTELLRWWDDAWRRGGQAGQQHHPDPKDVARRSDALDSLRDDGLRWLIIDRGVYDRAALDLVTDQLGERLVAQQDFAEGDGITVLELAVP